MPDQLNYETLMKQCQQDNVIAFEKLYQQSSPKLYGLLLTLMGQQSLAEEVLQEAYLTIWQRINTYDVNKGKAITWMMTIARNKGLDRLRALKVRPELDNSRNNDIEVIIKENRLPDNNIKNTQDWEQLKACLKQLSNDQCDCILMSFYYGYTHKELSLKLNRPLGTIKAWLRRGLDKIRECLP